MSGSIYFLDLVILAFLTYWFPPFSVMPVHIAFCSAGSFPVMDFSMCDC